MENYATQRLWFKARRYGWGWTPCSVEGWAVTIFAVLALVTGDCAIALLAGRQTSESPWVQQLLPQLSRSQAIAAVIAWDVVVLIPMIWIAWRKGERPRWRRGEHGRS